MKNDNQLECKQSTRTSKPVRIDSELVEKLEELARLTRTPTKDIASNAIRFALQYAVTRPIECYDVEFVIKG